MQTAHGVPSARVLSPALIVTGALVWSRSNEVAPTTPGSVSCVGGSGPISSATPSSRATRSASSSARLSAWIGGATGLPRLHLLGAWPIWLQVLFFVVTHDLYIYLFHRLQHRSPTLWRLHEAHHATTEVDWLSGSRSHAFEC